MRPLLFFGNTFQKCISKRQSAWQTKDKCSIRRVNIFFCEICRYHKQRTLTEAGHLLIVILISASLFEANDKERTGIAFMRIGNGLVGLLIYACFLFFIIYVAFANYLSDVYFVRNLLVAGRTLRWYLNLLCQQLTQACVRNKKKADISVNRKLHERLLHKR